MWIQTRSNQCPSDVKNFMVSVSRPASSLNRLGSFASFGIKRACQESDSGVLPKGDLAVILAEQGFIFKQTLGMNYAFSAQTKA